MAIILAAAVEAAAAGSDGGTVVLILGAITALLGSVFAALYKFSERDDARFDRLSVESMRQMVARATAAEESAARLLLERNEASAREAAAYKERDRWQEMAMQEQEEVGRLRVLLAMREAQIDAMGASPNDG